MGRCIIIAPLYAGEEAAWLAKEDGDLLICADGGYAAAIRHGLIPDLTVGDFDSMPAISVKGDILRLPVEKDDTDMLVCIKQGRARGFRDFVAAGCLGGRFDHTIACLQCSADCAQRGETLWLCDAQNRVVVLPPGRHILPRMEGRKLSLLAYTPEVRNVTLRGTKWELTESTLNAQYPLGCSNEWVQPEAILSFEEGLLVVCCSADAN